MADTLAEYITKTLIEGASMEAVEGRVFHVNLDQLSNPVYPLVVFGRRRPGGADPMAPFLDYSVMFQFCSTNGYDEAWALYEAAKTLLDKTSTVSAGGKAVYLRQDTAPIEDAFADGGPTVYRVIVLFTGRETG
jgi:hypothetical protein